MARFCWNFVLILCVGAHRTFGDVEVDDDFAQRAPENGGRRPIIHGVDGGNAFFERGTPIEPVEIYKQSSTNVTGPPAPVNITVTKYKVLNSSKEAEFRMTWSISSKQDLRAFRVVICAPKCVGEELPSSQFAIGFSVSFYTNFNASVVSLFGTPDALRLLSRPSDIYEYLSGVGPPSRVPTIKHKLGNNSLELVWDPPAPPNGPIDFYILNISDALNSTCQQQLRPNESHVNINFTGMSGYAFEILLQAVNVDHNSSEIFSGPVLNITLIHKRADEPSAVNLTLRTTDLIRFEISPPTSEKLPFVPFYEIKTLANIQDKSHVSDAVVFEHLTPYEKVSFAVSTCYKTELFKRYVCGKPFEAEERSNVAAPSKVSTLSLSSSGSEVVLRWTSPNQPNGPIDGFKVFITDFNDPKKEINHTLASSASSITFAPEAFIRGKSYKLTVAAFNVDLQNGELYIGERTTVIQWSPGSWVTVVIVISVLVVLGGLGAGFLYFVKSRRDTSGFANF